MKKINLDQTFYVNTNVELLKKYFGINNASPRKCIYQYNDYYIWMIALDGKKSKEGWINTINYNQTEILEKHQDDDFDNPTHSQIPFNSKRIVFDKSNPNYFKFVGIYQINNAKSDTYLRVWDRIAESFNV